MGQGSIWGRRGRGESGEADGGVGGQVEAVWSWEVMDAVREEGFRDVECQRTARRNVIPCMGSIGMSNRASMAIDVTSRLEHDCHC